MDKTTGTGTQNSRARRDFPHAAKKNEMLSCVDSHLRTWTTPMDRDKTPCVEKTRSEMLPNVDKNLWLVENLWTSTSTVHANDVRTICS